MAENESCKLSPEKNKNYQSLTLSETTENPNTDPEAVPPPKKKKVPRKVVHCSDGVYEEYSTDEEEIEEKKREEEIWRKRTLIDPKTLTWYPWVFHMSWLGGTNILAYADSWGEKLAWFFGITSPKYYWELEEFKKMSAEEEELKKKEAEENFGWTEKGEESEEKILEQPSLATLDATQLKEPAIFYQASTCDHEVDTTSQDNLDFGAEINKSD